jgi:hypothetical protein
MTYAIGDPNHLGVHNDTVSRIAALANNGGFTVTLPDTANLGDTGHVDDHNLILGALLALEAAPPGHTPAIASGGTESTYVGNGTNGVSGQNYKVHKFTADGTLTVSRAGEADIFIVGGGGGGGAKTGLTGGGGGAGGVIQQSLVLTATAFTVKVGSGGAAGPGTSGNPSSFNALLALGGGHGGTTGEPTGYPGGSGGGASCRSGSGGNGTFGQGNAGGSSSGAAEAYGGGGGGAGGVGSTGATGTAGPGLASSITGAAVTYAAGGNGQGGGGSASANTGTGGNGGNASGGAGGSGVVIVRYKV